MSFSLDNLQSFRKIKGSHSMALILVVDDSQDDLILVAGFLRNLGHSCRLATSGKLALDVLSAETFDLIISDYQMVDGDGVWLLNELQKISSAPKCILLTSDVTYSADFFLSHGAAGFTEKPLNWSKLRKEIDRLL
jgi:CheY-like chemotaxis protein